MSTLPSTEKPRKQPPSVYTVILILAMLFMLVAVIAMYVELGRWAPDYYRTNSAQPGAMLVPVNSSATFA
ncbi:hypothetical protein [Novipirellula sp.]|uniref:hypothetical protein n=1 Tax=Novipirellula sp. TaxID=2795430 RepID=UPI003563481C